jgi:uncharacterized membrane protein YfcA
VSSLILPALTLFAVLASFTLSASAGLGGSLVLVPALALVLGTKAGVALAALLLAGNNVLKIIAYRRSLPLRQSLAMVVLVALGAALGARLLVTAPERIVTVSVIGAFVATLLSERLDAVPLRRVGAPVLAFASGATSGFSGTSGPLKGVAIRSLGVDRQHFVGAASLVSFAGDFSKSAVYAKAGLLGSTELAVAFAAVPLMVLGTVGGRLINQELGERGFSVLFWTVIVGYSGRLLWGFVA